MLRRVRSPREPDPVQVNLSLLAGEAPCAARLEVSGDARLRRDTAVRAEYVPRVRGLPHPGLSLRVWAAIDTHVFAVLATYDAQNCSATGIIFPSFIHPLPCLGVSTRGDVNGVYGPLVGSRLDPVQRDALPLTVHRDHRVLPGR